MNKILISLIKGYQLTLSPIFKIFLGGGCRFTPTCSDYTIEALSKFGTVKGTTLGIKRFLKCHPFGASGYDPVPTK